MTFAKRTFVASVAAMMSIACAGSASAASFRGRVTGSDGRPAFGAMVTVMNPSKEQRETVYTGPDGSYAIRTPFAGALSIRARMSGFDDDLVHSIANAEQIVDLDLRLKPFADARAASDALSASAFNARLPWPDTQRDRKVFVQECNYCHQVGNATTRVPRSHAEWMAELDKMEEGLLSLLSRQQKRMVAGVLAKGFDGKPVVAHQNYGASVEQTKAKIREWQVGDGFTFIHDAFVARDQTIYGMDEGHDVIWTLDRATGKIDRLPLPASDLPRGGLFSGLKLPIGVFTGKHGPHSMAETSDGRLWITNSLSSTLMSLDPKTKTFKTYDTGPDALYPHTIRVDANDIVWFTLAVSNHVGRFDPKTELMTLIELPANGIVRWISTSTLPVMMRIGSWFPARAWHLNISTHRLYGNAVIPMPYGIDVNPLDGSIWYAKLYASMIGRIDPKTFEITEWETPMKGPRRPRFDKNGALWIPAFDEGGLMRFDTRTQKFESMVIPPVGDGEYETPYALNVSPATGDIWLAANNSDRIIRYAPSSKEFLNFPSPTRVTVLRDFSLARDGEVCSSSSNLPSSAIEDGRASFLCIDPAAGAADRAALARPN